MDRNWFMLTVLLTATASLKPTLSIGSDPVEDDPTSNVNSPLYNAFDNGASLPTEPSTLDDYHGIPSSPPTPSSLPNQLIRIDCHPENGATQPRCLTRGCTWARPILNPADPFAGGEPNQSPDDDDGGDKTGPVNGVPSCYFNNTDPAKWAGYDLLASSSGQMARRTRQFHYVGKLVRRATPTIFGYDYQKIRVQINQMSSTHVRIFMSGVGQPPGDYQHKHVKAYTFHRLRKYRRIIRRHRRRRFSHKKRIAKLMELRELNSTNANVLTKTSSAGTRPAKSFKYKYTADYSITVQDSPFGILINRSGSNFTIFDTRNIPGFTFSKHFIQLSTKLATNFIYGFGEHQRPTLRRQFDWHKWALFARDYAPRGDQANLYGSHPFYMGLEPDGKAHGVLLLNSHAMNVALQPNPNILTYRVIGGLIELHVILGDSPDHVVQQYTAIVGRPTMPPYWGLGYQLCRFGSKNLSYVDKVWERNHKAKIPLDVQFLDIDYMDGRKDFTYDETRFKEMKTFVDKLHTNNQKLVLMVDPAISANPVSSYKPLILGNQMNVFIKDGQHPNQSFVGKCWPGNTVWPDFTHHNATGYWTQLHKEFHDKVSFDGVWNDMNEPSNMHNGAITPVDGCATNLFNNPPYSPVDYSPLYENTVCLDALQHAGHHYYLHNLYGHSEVETSYAALTTLFPGQRPFVLTRSSFPGTGQFAAKWTGDIQSTWDQLHWSIIGMLEFNIFGIPWVGADICGFDGNTNEELCIRWHQVGVFYPFSRNHNSDENTVDQDPAAWSPNATEAIKIAINQRYRMLPYLNTLFDKANSEGSSVARPLFFNFPKDPNTWSIDSQFMWGDSMMVAPILQKNSSSRTAYFPSGTWYRLNASTTRTHFSRETGRSYPSNPSTIITNRGAVGNDRNISIPWNETGVFVRGGHILPAHGKLRHPSDNVQSTVDARKLPIELIIAMDRFGRASGSLYWDDGLTIDSRKIGAFVEFIFDAKTIGRITELSIRRRSSTLNAKWTASLGPLNLTYFQFLGWEGTQNGRAWPKKITVTSHSNIDATYMVESEHPVDPSYIELIKPIDLLREKHVVVRLQ